MTAATNDAPRLWIAVPAYSGVTSATFVSLMGLTEMWASAGGRARCVTHGGPIVSLLRDQMTEHMVARAGLADIDIVLWLDADMSFEPAEMMAFVQRTPGNAIVTVAGRKKSAEVVWCCELARDQSDADRLPDYLRHLRRGVAGAACVAMRGSTLRRLFEAAREYKHNEVTLREVWPMGVMAVSSAPGAEPVTKFIGEDLGLCFSAQQLGVGTFVDPGVWLGHWDGRTCYGGRLSDGEGVMLDGSRWGSPKAETVDT